MTFLVAGVYGLLVILLQYFMEGRVGRDCPPGVGHAEYFCGVMGLCVAWQGVFLVVARDAVGMRPGMVTWAVTVPVLFAMGTAPGVALGYVKCGDGGAHAG